MATSAAHFGQATPHIGPSPSGPTDELAAAFTHVMTTLQDLASRCRGLGMDPMAMIARMMRPSSGTPRASGIAAPQSAMPPMIRIDVVPAPIPAQTDDDAGVVTRSHDFIDALDRDDVIAVAAALAPGFVHFVDGAAIDRDTMLTMIMQRKSNVRHIAKRVWEDERVVRNDDIVVFTGKAHEVQGGNDTHGGYLYDGWYLVQWVRAGDAWRVQLLTWQKESTGRDWWNHTFRKGRGFALEPNRLLVETVRDTEPGAALELAMGQGRNALYLASQGWRVTGVDISDEGLRIAREQAIKRDLEIETINADIDEWDFGVNRFDLVTLLYVGDHARWIDKIKASLRSGGVFVVEGWANVGPDSPYGFADGQLAKLFEGYEILRDETVEDVPDWAWDKGKLVRFVARKR